MKLDFKYCIGCKDLYVKDIDEDDECVSITYSCSNPYCEHREEDFINVLHEIDVI